MTVESSQLTKPNPKRRRGCLRSCLIVSVVLFSLVLVSGVAVYFVGRSYLERNLPVWEARYPTLGLALDLLELRGEFAAVEEELQASGEKQAGVNDKGQMPDDIPLYDDPLVETYSVGEAQGVGFQRIAGEPDAVLGHLREVMQQYGWDLLEEQETAWGRILIWRKGERACQTEVVTSDVGAEIWIRYTG